MATTFGRAAPIGIRCGSMPGGELRRTEPSSCGRTDSPTAAPGWPRLFDGTAGWPGNPPSPTACPGPAVGPPSGDWTACEDTIQLPLLITDVGAPTVISDSPASDSPRDGGAAKTPFGGLENDEPARSGLVWMGSSDGA